MSSKLSKTTVIFYNFSHFSCDNFSLLSIFIRGKIEIEMNDNKNRPQVNFIVLFQNRNSLDFRTLSHNSKKGIWKKKKKDINYISFINYATSDRNWKFYFSTELSLFLKIYRRYASLH